LQRILCICICGSFPAPSNAIRFYFGPSSFSPQVSQICGSLVAGFVIRTDILLGWYYEALVTAFDLLYVLVNVQSFFHLSCCLRSSQSFRMFAALFMCGLGSFVTTLKVSNGNSLALEQPLTVVYSFSLVCAVTVDALLLFSPHSWQLGKKCDSSCFLTLNRSSLGCDSLVFSVMEPTFKIFHLVWVIVLQGALCRQWKSSVSLVRVRTCIRILKTHRYYKVLPPGFMTSLPLLQCV